MFLYKDISQFVVGERNFYVSFKFVSNIIKIFIKKKTLIYRKKE